MANDFQKYGVYPSKKLGQNFLIDKNIVHKIISQIESPNNRIILEIGPGLGGLTETLLESKAKKIIAVEYDRACIRYLYDLQEHHKDRLEVVPEDALDIDESEFAKEEKIIIVSNLPYNISVVLLLKWLDKITHIDHMVLMFQKEVAERIVAKPGNKVYGIASVLVQYLCDVEYRFDVSPNVFFPPPKILSAVIRVRPKKDIAARLETYPKIKIICNKVFNQRRKMLRNTLKDLFEFPDAVLLKAHLDGELRPEQLSVEDFEKLASFL